MFSQLVVNGRALTPYANNSRLYASTYGSETLKPPIEGPRKSPASLHSDNRSKRGRREASLGTILSSLFRARTSSDAVSQLAKRTINTTTGGPFN